MLFADEQSAQNSGSTVSSAAGVSLPPMESGGQNRGQPVSLPKSSQTQPYSVTKKMQLFVMSRDRQMTCVPLCSVPALAEEGTSNPPSLSCCCQSR